MKWEITIHSHFPLKFVTELTARDLLKLENILAAGQSFPVSHQAMPYVPEPEARWPVGPTLADT